MTISEIIAAVKSLAASLAPKAAELAESIKPTHLPIEFEDNGLRLHLEGTTKCGGYPARSFRNPELTAMAVAERSIRHGFRASNYRMAGHPCEQD